MKKIFRPCILLALVLILPISASGYIPSAHFIIKMMLEGNGAIDHVMVEQTAIIFDEDSGGEALRVPGVLYLKLPDGYRLDMTLPYEKKTSIYRKGEIFTIVDGEIVSRGPDRRALFKDFLIRHSVNRIMGLLRSKHVNIERTGLGRFGGKVSYIIGAGETETEFPQLWIEKDSFLPLRFVAKEKREESIVTVEVRYLDYRHIDDKFRYPSTIEFYADDKLTLRYQTEKVMVNTSMPDNVFDMKKLIIK